MQICFSDRTPPDCVTLAALIAILRGTRPFSTRGSTASSGHRATRTTGYFDCAQLLERLRQRLRSVQVRSVQVSYHTSASLIGRFSLLGNLSFRGESVVYRRRHRLMCRNVSHFLELYKSAAKTMSTLRGCDAPASL